MVDYKISNALCLLMPFISDTITSELRGNEDSLLDMLNNAVTEIKSNNRDLDIAMKCTKNIINRTWEHLNTGKWDNVPKYYKALYSYACFIKMIILLKQAKMKCEHFENFVTKAIKYVDKGLLLGGSLRKELTHAAKLLSSCLDIVTTFDELTCKIDNNFGGIKGEMIPVVNCPSLECFNNNFFVQQLPVKLTGCIDHWPALNLWKNVKYMFKMIGLRTVPIEIGSSYTSSNWSQKLMTGKEFIERFILYPESQLEKGYLAQHQLFNQIPELLNDIREPEYCYLSEDTSNSTETGTDINMWFGPCNTISPLHYDPKHNLLAQVVGSKRILLYDPKWSDCLYPYEDTLLFNTSQIDLTKPDYYSYPKFDKVRAVECILHAGEILYIPPKWWHYVTSLSPSISVSFWWGI